MRDYIYRLVAILPSFLRSAGRWIADRLYAVWDDIFHVLSRLRLPWSLLVNAGRAFLAALQEWGTELYFVAWWLRYIWLPKLISDAINKVRKWAAATVEAVRRVLAATIENVRRWAVKAVNGALSFIRNVQTWAGKKLAQLTKNASDLVRNLRHVLSGPGALASWLVGAMWRAFLAYTYQQRNRIATWLLRSSTAFTLWLARTLEDVIRRIL